MPRYTVDIINRSVITAKNKADAEKTATTRFMEYVNDIRKVDIESHTEEILDNLDGDC